MNKLLSLEFSHFTSCWISFAGFDKVFYVYDGLVIARNRCYVFWSFRQSSLVPALFWLPEGAYEIRTIKVMCYLPPVSRILHNVKFSDAMQKNRAISNSSCVLFSNRVSRSQNSTLDNNLMPGRTGNFGEFWMFITVFVIKGSKLFFYLWKWKTEKDINGCNLFQARLRLSFSQKENSWIFLFRGIGDKYVYALKSFGLFLQFSFLVASDNCVVNLRIWSLNRSRHLTKLWTTFITKASINLSNAEKYWNISSFAIF